LSSGSVLLQADPRDAVRDATAVPDLLPGFARHPRESLSTLPFDRRLIDLCGRAFARLVPTPAVGGLIAVVGPGRGEGRSTVAAALATSIVRDTDVSVLLLDLDFERPRQTDLFRVASSPGLGEFLEGASKLRLVAGSAARRLWLGAAGSSSREPSRLSHDLLGSGLLAALQERFAWIVADLPPISEPAAQTIARVADYQLFVGRHRQTTLAGLERSLELAGGDRPAGFLLTGDQSRIPAWIKRLL